MIKVINPTNSKVGQKFDLPVIFLAGPIVDADDWQTKAIKYFTQLCDKYKIDLIIATPRLNKDNTNRLDRDDQVKWESYYLNKAYLYGIILFWLANKQKTTPDRSFARTSRFELGEWLVKSQKDNYECINIGIDTEFDGQEYIKLRLEGWNYPNKVHDNLVDLVKDTFKRIKNR